MLFATIFVLATVLKASIGRTPINVWRDAESVDDWGIRLHSDNGIRVISLGDYLKGVVAAEMGPTFSDEALKAQFVAARTYALYRILKDMSCPSHPSADLCADSATHQAYIDLEDLRRNLGPPASSFLARLEEARRATSGLVIKYDGSLIDPLYHSVSGTETEAAEEYFGQSAPYLLPVDDRWGAATAPKLTEILTITWPQLSGAIYGNPDALPPKGADIRIDDRTASGRVKTLQIGSLMVSGRDFREKLGLRSTNFTIAPKDDSLVITTTGSGHGVGMSQYGAEGMARAGYGFIDILKYYYSGVTVTSMSLTERR